MTVMLRSLIAPAFAIAALCASSTALAADPSSGSVDAAQDALDAQSSEDTDEADAEVVASEAVTLENEVAASAEVSTSAAQAGRLAIGAARTGAGLNGITVRYFVSDSFHIGVNIGVATFSFREPDFVDDATDCAMDATASSCDKTIRTLAYIGSSLEGMYWVHGKPAGALPFRADFGVGGRLGFQHLVNGNDVPDDLDDPLQFTAEIPLALALNFGENFAIIPEFGAVFRWNPGTRLTDADGNSDTNPGFNDPNGRITQVGPGFGFELGDHVGLFGGATLLYTF